MRRAILNTTAATTPPSRIRPRDAAYAELAGRGNRRYQGRPEVIRPVSTTDQVVTAVQEAVDAGHRLAARSGGHNLEDFVDDHQVHTVIDASRMRHIGYDADRRAFVVEPGVMLGELYRRLAEGWGVILPAGLYPGVGVGDHLAGGGYGYLSRLHGLAVDHLQAVEVVVVPPTGALAPSSRAARARTRICGGRIPAAEAAPSASSPGTGCARPARADPLPRGSCRRRRPRC